MLVRDAMSTNVVTVGPDDLAWTAGETLMRLELTGLPVIDAERYVLGLVTERDLTHALLRGEDLHAVPVARVMHAHPLFVEPETDLRTATEVMDEWQVRRLPVCRDGLLVGVISRADVLRALMTGAAEPQSR